MMRFFLLFAVFMSILVISPIPSQACGGGRRLTLGDATDADVIVSATVLEVDDRGYNAILKVDRYFKGEGSVYLTVMRWTPSLEIGANIRGYSTACLYDGGGKSWILGSRGYFGLRDASNNGTYTDVETLTSGNVMHWIPEENIVEFYTRNELSEDVQHTVTIPEFEALLLEIGSKNQPIHPDDTNHHYPLKRFLTITTESGEQYQLNPDRSIKWLDPETTAIAISPDGTHLAFKLDDERVSFQYLWLQPLPEDYHSDDGKPHIQTGKSVEFSPDSNFAMVWDETHIAVYMFDNHERGGYGQTMGMQRIAQTELVWDNREGLPETAWSGDNTTIAYQDEAGIWTWNIFVDTDPTLILDFEVSVPVSLLDLSATGRYMRYGTSSEWTLLDIQTGETFENALKTPDESNLILIRPEFPENTIGVDIGGRRNCSAPLAETCPVQIEQGGIITDTFWYKDNQIAIVSCFDHGCYVGSHSWQIGVMTQYSRQRVDAPIPTARLVAYDAVYDQPLVVTEGGYTLEFDFYPSWVRDESADTFAIDSLNLEAYIDSPIAKLEWGQPIFYHISP